MGAFVTRWDKEELRQEREKDGEKSHVKTPEHENTHREAMKAGDRVGRCATFRPHVNRSELVIFRSVIEITHIKTMGVGGVMLRGADAAGQPGSCSPRSPMG